MKIINARLRHQEALYTLDLQDGVIKKHHRAGRGAGG